MGQLTQALDAVAALKAFEIGTMVLLIAILLTAGVLVVRQREHHEDVTSRLDRLAGVEPEAVENSDHRFYGGRR
jgi:predicted transporter